jgi:hypothetical protein
MRWGVNVAQMREIIKASNFRSVNLRGQEHIGKPMRWKNMIILNQIV